jgi:hypothetical protein
MHQYDHYARVARTTPSPISQPQPAPANHKHEHEHKHGKERNEGPFDETDIELQLGTGRSSSKRSTCDTALRIGRYCSILLLGLVTIATTLHFAHAVYQSVPPLSFIPRKLILLVRISILAVMFKLILFLLKFDHLPKSSNLGQGDIRSHLIFNNKIFDVSVQSAYMKLLSDNRLHLEALQLVHLFVFLLTATLIHLPVIIMMGTRPIHLE